MDARSADASYNPHLSDMAAADTPSILPMHVTSPAEREFPAPKMKTSPLANFFLIAFGTFASLTSMLLGGGSNSERVPFWVIFM